MRRLLTLSGFLIAATHLVEAIVRVGATLLNSFVLYLTRQ